MRSCGRECCKPYDTPARAVKKDMQQGQMDISGLLASDDVYVALEESLRSLEVPLRVQKRGLRGF